MNAGIQFSFFGALVPPQFSFSDSFCLWHTLSRARKRTHNRSCIVPYRRKPVQLQPDCKRNWTGCVKHCYQLIHRIERGTRKRKWPLFVRSTLILSTFNLQIIMQFIENAPWRNGYFVSFLLLLVLIRTIAHKGYFSKVRWRSPKRISWRDTTMKTHWTSWK